MTLENAKVLHKSLLEAGRTGAAENLEIRYPELADKKEEKKDGEKPKGRTNRASDK